MLIRRATVDDIGHCARLGLKFIEAAGMPAATIEGCIEFCARIIDHPDNAAMFVSPQGVIAGVIAPLYYRPDYLQAVELFWWAEDGHGRALLAAFEAWAIENGADDINMSTLDHFSHPGVEVLLKKRGYEGRDKTFRKVVT